MIDPPSRYTMNVVQSFSAQGTPIDILQVGNEINDGLLWPTGQISKNGYHPLSELLHSAINGAKAAGSPKILIHLANGWNWSGLDSWFSGVYVPGALSADQVDLIGVSFYPFYDAGATLAALRSSLTNAANTFGKPIVVAETDWPVSCSGVSLTEPSIAVSTSGQQTWVNDIKDVLAGLPNGRGRGICASCRSRVIRIAELTCWNVVYWEPGWIGNANLGSSCAVRCLVCPPARRRIDMHGHRTTSSSIHREIPELQSAYSARICKGGLEDGIICAGD